MTPRPRPLPLLASLSTLLLCLLAGGADAAPRPAFALPHLALPLAAMAVDRSKFRTCEQASFCRRHRHGRSRRLYDYSVVPGSVEAVVGPHPGGAGEDPPRAGGAGGGMLTKFGRRLGIGGGGGADGGGGRPPPDGVGGPGPVLTARIRNGAPLTSSALTARVYGGCDGAVGADDHGEELNLDVHLHADGVARVRITEVLGAADGPRSEPRWTSDELVLNAGEMTSVDAGDVTYSATDAGVLGGLGGAGTGGEGAAGLIASLARRAGLGGQPTDGFLVLSHGDWRLMIRMSPFSVYYFRGGDGEDGPPMIVAGTGGLTHFEVRRDRGCPPAAGERRQLGEFDVEVDGDSSEDEEPEEYTGEEGEEEPEADAEEDRHGGKEIVGYWEDGLAIYADGTREERRELVADDAGEGREQRRLDEGDFDTDGMWEERFGDHHDTKPRGPMSVGMELTFPGSTHLFGLPEHASSTQLRATGGKDGRHHHYNEPYR